MTQEAIDTINSIFPVSPVKTDYNQFLLVKEFSGERVGWIKPTDKTITKIGKGTVMGLGMIISIPFALLGFFE